MEFAHTEIHTVHIIVIHFINHSKGRAKRKTRPNVFHKDIVRLTLVSDSDNTPPTIHAEKYLRF